MRFTHCLFIHCIALIQKTTFGVSSGVPEQPVRMIDQPDDMPRADRRIKGGLRDTNKSAAR